MTNKTLISNFDSVNFVIKMSESRREQTYKLIRKIYKLIDKDKKEVFHIRGLKRINVFDLLDAKYGFMALRFDLKKSVQLAKKIAEEHDFSKVYGVMEIDDYLDRFAFLFIEVEKKTKLEALLDKLLGKER